MRPILMAITNAEQHYVQIPYADFHSNRKKCGKYELKIVYIQSKVTLHVFYETLQ
jgi:hypothetical protein